MGDNKYYEGFLMFKWYIEYFSLFVYISSNFLYVKFSIYIRY